MPRILRRAAVRTVLIALVAVFAMAMLANADPVGSNYGGVNAVTAATAGAPTLAEVAADAGSTKTSLNFFFLIMGVGLIFFMQAGFMLVETGFCRSKHAAHVAMTNFVIFAVGALAYWAAGFALQFGSLGSFYWAPGAEGLLTGEAVKFGANAFAGTKGFFLGSLADGTYDPGVFAFFLFQMVFMDTAATIVTGGMAERWKFSAFLPFGVFMGIIVYPLYGMWVWGGGWLSTLGANYGFGHGVVDFAGSSVVHAVGGFAALAGAIVIGPRLGKFKADGTAVALPGHNIPMAILGTIILVFGWFGFNGMSTLAATDLRFSIIIANTILAGSAGCLAAMFLVWKLWGKPDPSMAVNGMLAGLVAITAPCAFVTPWASVIIGLVAGFLVVGSVVFVERKLKVDDPVGAVSVHGVNGAWGMIALGLFADGSYGAGWNMVDGPVKGLFYGDSGQLLAQGIAVVTVFAWAFGMHYIFFKVQDAIQGIRSSEADELGGLDSAEMGVLAYPDMVGAGPLGEGGLSSTPTGSSHPHPAISGSDV
ncbi:MAG: ammonium transporter [Actinobacteria bacterium HGW-Actinobacteria-7]|nr:MAG: ammonium transporter [Actinobacteria bacterium HGW-Actinobacteria-7]